MRLFIVLHASLLLLVIDAAGFSDTCVIREHEQDRLSTSIEWLSADVSAASVVKLSRYDADLDLFVEGVLATTSEVIAKVPVSQESVVCTRQGAEGGRSPPGFYRVKSETTAFYNM